jgi:chaperonin cofactor prefoldin
LNNDGYYYQGAYTLNGHVQEVKDENAIARAELEYNVQKSKLNTKEESLELQMKNLDMEISSLTTEYDTVKNLISKGIEKVFTMFST